MVSLFVDKTGVCTMSPAGPEIKKEYFLWNNEALPVLGINTVELLQQTLEYLERPEDNVQWSL